MANYTTELAKALLTNLTKDDWKQHVERVLSSVLEGCDWLARRLNDAETA